MAPDFIVEGPHRLALQVQVEIDVELALLANIPPNEGGCRLRLLPVLAHQRDEMRLVEPDDPLEAPSRRAAWFLRGRQARHDRRRRRRAWRLRWRGLRRV